jgi:hypothetical protein
LLFGGQLPKRFGVVWKLRMVAIRRVGAIGTPPPRGACALLFGGQLPKRFGLCRVLLIPMVCIMACILDNDSLYFRYRLPVFACKPDHLAHWAANREARLK